MISKVVDTLRSAKISGRAALVLLLLLFGSFYLIPNLLGHGWSAASGPRILLGKL